MAKKINYGGIAEIIEDRYSGKVSKTKNPAFAGFFVGHSHDFASQNRGWALA